jgi:hypothetical protein
VKASDALALLLTAFPGKQGLQHRRANVHPRCSSSSSNPGGTGADIHVGVRAVNFARNAPAVSFTEARAPKAVATANSPKNQKERYRVEEKSSWLSRCVRFVIAGHSPGRVLESGLLMEALEKNRCNRSEAAWGPILSGPFDGGNTARGRPFPHISRATQQNISAVETCWRREVDSNPVYRFTYSGFLNRQRQIAESCNPSRLNHLPIRTEGWGAD